MREATMSFLTLSDVYNLAVDVKKHKFKNKFHTYFYLVLHTHLMNGLWAYCTITTGLAARATTVFKTPGGDDIMTEVVGTFRPARIIFGMYAAYTKKNKEAKQDQLGGALLAAGLDMSAACKLSAILITESLQDQLNLAGSAAELDNFAEYVCKSILLNLNSKVIKQYMLADSTNPEIAISTFAIACLFSTFVSSKAKKISFGSATSEGMLTRSGIKYAVPADDTLRRGSVICLTTKTSRIAKYHSREMYPAIWALFISLFPKDKYTVHHTAVRPSGLTSFNIVNKSVSVRHEAMGHPARVAITDVPSHLCEINLRDTGTSGSSSDADSAKNDAHKSAGCFSFLIAFYSFLTKILRSCTPMGTTFSKDKGKNTFFSEPPENRIAVDPSLTHTPSKKKRRE